jgi:hypothetical protein
MSRDHFRGLNRIVPMAAAILLGGPALSGCGGGGGSGGDAGGNSGGGNLVVDFHYETNAIYLWRSSRLTPVLSGIDGHAPNCVVASGTLPPGMSLDARSCAMGGTPTQAGVYSPTIQLTVPGYQGQITQEADFVVFGPPVTYPQLDVVGLFQLTTPYSFPATNINASLVPDWQPQAGETVVYSIHDGALPAGLSLAPATGTLSGQLSALGSSNFTVQVVATKGSQVSTQLSTDLGIAVTSQPIAISYTTTYSGPTGQAFSSAPSIYSYGQPWTGATYRYTLATGSVLPPGVTLDSSSGVISGTPTAGTQAGKNLILIDVVVTHDGASFSMQASASVYIV